MIPHAVGTARNKHKKAEQTAIDTLIAGIVDEYAAWYFENEDRGIKPYIQKMIDGYAPLI